MAIFKSGPTMRSQAIPVYELINVAGRTSFIQSPTNVGLYRIDEKNVCIIDSGNDKDAGRKVKNILAENGWNLTAIYNTHAHADHIGGNKYLQGQTGCRIFTPEIECAFARHTILQSMSIYGACPLDELRHKILLAQESDAQPLTEDSVPEGFEIIPLRGHSIDMTAYRTPDDVVFLGDCIASQRVLEKYGVVFLHDVGAYLESLEKVEKMQAKAFIPAHVEMTEDIAPLARFNIEKTLETASRIEELCSDGTTFEEVLKGVFDAYSIHMDAVQYALVGSTVRSYLTWLKSTGRVAFRIEDNRMLWAKV